MITTSEAQEKASEKQPNRAGLVCFNHAGEVLIVEALTVQTKWVFPKGHIEKGEDVPTAAVRECLEECGIVATTLNRICQTSFLHMKEEVTVEWWAGFGVRKANPKLHPDMWIEDWRNARWVSVEEAFKLLSFGDLKGVLRKALCHEY